MVRKSPCEYYLKYLVTHPANYSDEQIGDLLFDRGLDGLDATYLSRVKRQTVRPVPFLPYDLEHQASQYFLNKHRIYTLYHKDPHTKEALFILEHPKVKEFCEAMLLAGAPPGLVARGASESVSTTALTAAGVRRFQHYFWNTDLLDFTEMRAVVAKRGTGSGDPDYKKAFYRDSRKVACDLPFSPISALLSQIRMGVMPRGINFAELMERVRTVAGLKAFAALLDDSLDSSEHARNFMAAAVGATDLLERSAHPEEKLRERFNSLGIEQEERPIPHINQLSEGRHTTDLQALETREELSEVDDEA